MKKSWLNLILLWVLASQLSQAGAQEIIMTRSKQPFPETMLVLQESIRAHGYTVSRVQRIDIGLTGMGYKTDKYRIVFAGKPEEIRMLTDRVPELIPYLPPKISIFAEGDQTVLVTIHPEIYARIAGDAIDPVFFQRWASDLESIFHDVSTAE